MSRKYPQVEGRAKRGFRIENKRFAKGDKISLPRDQFEGLEGVGLVERPSDSKAQPKAEA